MHSLLIKKQHSVEVSIDLINIDSIDIPITSSMLSVLSSFLFFSSVKVALILLIKAPVVT